MIAPLLVGLLLCLLQVHKASLYGETVCRKQRSECRMMQSSHGRVAAQWHQKRGDYYCYASGGMCMCLSAREGSVEE